MKIYQVQVSFRSDEMPNGCDMELLRVASDAVVDWLDDQGWRYKMMGESVEFSVVQALDPAKNELGGFRSTDPDTSRKAAQDNYMRSGSQSHKLFLAVAAAGENGLTAWEGVEKTGIPYKSLSPRAKGLKRKGLVSANGKTRPTDTGSKAEVLVLTDQGRRQIAKHEGIHI